MIKDPAATKNKIIGAFLKCYENNRIEQITIGDIAREAKINRGTFYYYYKDVYDLMEHIEQQIFEEVVEKITQVVEYILNQDIELLAEVIKEFLGKYQVLVRLFIVKKPNLVLQRKIKERGKQILLKRLAIDERDLSVEQKYLLEYMTSGQLGLVTYWIEHNQDMSPPQLAKVIEMANLNGALTSIKKLAEH